MRILYHSAHPHLDPAAPAGYATHMREVIAALRRRGHEVETLIAGVRPPGEPPATPGTAPGRPDGRRRLRRVIPGPVWQALRDVSILRHDRRAASLLRVRIRSFRPEVIYERAAWLCSSGIREGRAAGIPVLLEVNAPYVAERRRLAGSSLLAPLGRRWQREALRFASRVVAVSSPLAEYLADAAGMVSDSFRTAPNAVDPRRFHPGVADERVNLGIPETALVVGFTGSFLAWHGLDLLIEAVAALSKNRPDLHCLLVGDGEIRGSIERLVGERGISNRVTFTGRVAPERVPGLIRAMDIGVVPGHEWYCSPIKLFEYGGIGRAVIARDSLPVRQVLADGREGILVGERVEELTDAIRRLADDPAWRRGLADAFHRRTVMSHTWDARAEWIEAWALEVAGRCP